jgi:uncharacterized integral membrane protein
MNARDPGDLSPADRHDEPDAHEGGPDEQEHQDWTPRGRTKTAQGITITLLFVGLLTAIFVLQNTDSVPVRFLFWKTSAPLAGALLLAVVLGGILAFLVAFIRQRQYKRAMKKEHSVHARKRG